MILMQAYKMVRKTFIQRAERVAFDNALDLIAFQGKLGLNFELELAEVRARTRLDDLVFQSLLHLFHDRVLHLRRVGDSACSEALSRSCGGRSSRRWCWRCPGTRSTRWLRPGSWIPYGYPFIDTLAVYGPNYFSDSGLVTANRYAAMPSMHCGWTLIGGVMLAYAYPKWRIGAIVGGTHTALMFFTVMVTGNHFVLDIVGGVLVAGAAFAVAYWFPVWRGWVLDRIGLSLTARPRTQTAQASPRAD